MAIEFNLTPGPSPHVERGEQQAQDYQHDCCTITHHVTITGQSIEHKFLSVNWIVVRNSWEETNNMLATDQATLAQRL
jgi:hypothetical protein